MDTATIRIAYNDLCATAGALAHIPAARAQHDAILRSARELREMLPQSAPSAPNDPNPTHPPTPHDAERQRAHSAPGPSPETHATLARERARLTNHHMRAIMRHPDASRDAKADAASIADAALELAWEITSAFAIPDPTDDDDAERKE